MKHFLKIILALLISTHVCYSQTLEFIPPTNQQGTGELLTGSPFSLRFYMTAPAGCYSANISFDIPDDIYISPVNGTAYTPVGHWACASSCSSGSTAIIESLVNLVPGSQIDMNVNLKLRNGDVCENEPYNLNYSVEFFDIDGNSCGAPQMTNTVSFNSKYADNYWSSSISKVTPDSIICKGGYIKYKICVPRKSGFGGYNLTNSSVNVSYLGQAFKVYDANYNEIPGATSTSNGCNNVTTIPRNFTVGASSSTYYLIAELPCNGCDYEALYFDANTYIVGDPPCNAPAVSITGGTTSFPAALVGDNNVCCGSYAGSNYGTKNIAFDNAPLCPGSCSPVTYSLTFDNTLSNKYYGLFFIKENLPDDFIVTSINVNPLVTPSNTYFSDPSKNINLNVSTDNGTSWYVYNSTLGNTNINPYTDKSIPSGTPITDINFTYYGVRAFAEYIKLNISGYFTEDAIIGHTYTNCVEFIGGTLLDEQCVSAVMNNCEPEAELFTEAYDTGSPSTVLQTLVDNKFTIRMSAFNTGTSELLNGSIEMLLPSDFTYCNNGARIYYGGSNPGTNFANNPAPECGGTFLATGQTITYSGFDLPITCNGFKQLVIDFDVYLDEDAFAVPHTIDFDLIAENLSSQNAYDATIYINGIYNVDPQLSVSCTPFNCEEEGDSIAYAAPGDTVYFKYSLTNNGNTLLTTTDIINHIPRIGDFDSKCGLTRNSQFNINYTQATPIENCNNVDAIYTYDLPAVCPPSITGPFSINSTSMQITTQDTLFPDSTVQYIFQGVVDPTASVGSIAVNDFGFEFIRSDVTPPIPTPREISNQVQIILTPGACGEFDSSDDISCALTGLTLTDAGDCCVSLSMNNNIYAGVFDSVKLVSTGGEYFSTISPAVGFTATQINNGDALILQPEDGTDLVSGTYTIGTFCIDPLYSSSQFIQATLLADSIGNDANVEICPVTLEKTCDEISLDESWSKYFGGQENVYTRNVKSYGNHIFVLGYKVTNGGEPYTPVMAKFNFDGTLVWQREYSDYNSLYFDFEISDDYSELLLVGQTFPNSYNSSLFARVNTSDGQLIEGKIFTNAQRERFSKIIRHSNPSDTNFPYYVLGVYNGGHDKPIILNIDEGGNVNWQVELNEDSDDQFFYHIFELLDGNLVVMGDSGSGVNELGLITIDGANGNVLNSKKRSGKSFPTLGFDFGDGIAVSSYHNGTLIPFISIFDYNLDFVESIEFSNLGVFRSFFQGENGKIYGMSNNIVDPGSGGGGDEAKISSSSFDELNFNGQQASYNKPVIVEFDLEVLSTAPLTVDFEVVSGHEFSLSGEDFRPPLLATNLNKLIFNNSVQRYVSTSGGNAILSWDMNFGILDYDLSNSNCLDTFEIDTTYVPFTMSSFTIDDIPYTLPSPSIYTQSDSTFFTCSFACTPDCIAEYTYILSSSANGCGVLVDFDNLSTNTDGMWNWNFGDGTPVIHDENPSHLFDSPGIYNVCLGVPECPDGICQKIKIKFDTKLPKLICQSEPITLCADNECVAYGANPTFSLSGGNLNCTDTLITRDDGLALTDPYPLGTTFITIEISNDFGGLTKCQIPVVVEDCSPPILFCSEDITVQAEYDETTAPVFWNYPNLQDNCADSLFYYSTSESGDLYPCGTTSVLVNGYDNYGNASQCAFTITVECDTTSSRCGMAAVTCFPGFVNNSPAQGIDFNAPVFGLVDIRDRSGVSPGYWASESGSNIYHPASWSASSLGLVFGITIDDSDNVFLAASTIYGCDEPNFPAFASGGASGIYKIDPQDNITTAISTGAYDVSGAGTTIPNNGGGLGNICYNGIHQMCYVSNLSDGQIYQINNLGQVSNRYDPFLPTADNLQFAPLGDRPWGIAYNPIDNRLYYSNWVEDRARPNLNQKNEIWRVDLDNNGDIIVGTEMLVIEIPDHIDSYNPNTYSDYSNPVSDISFSHQGLMLIGERSMNDDCGAMIDGIANIASKYAHNSRVLEYEEGCAGWTLTDGHGAIPFTNLNVDLKYRIGSHGGNNTGSNAAGGIDYGYSSMEEGMDIQCSDMIWSSADFMWQCNPSNRIYGMQGTYASGGHECNSYLIDYDGLTSPAASFVKVMQGDVEVFKCYECTPPPALSCCSTFDENDSGWNTIAASISTTTYGPSLSSDDYYLRAKDGSGASWIYNSNDYTGDFTSYDGSCLCWDYRVFNDGSSASLNVSPVLRIFSGNPSSPTLEAQFVSNILVTENEGWTNICAPISIGTSSLPSNDLGEWIMRTGSGVADWNTLLSSVDGIRFYMDLTSSPSEVYGFDNICIDECGNLPSTECPGFSQTTITQDMNTDACCFSYDINYPYPNDTIQDELIFTILTPGVTYGSFTSDSLINNDFNNPDRVKSVVAGDGSVYFCLNNVEDMVFPEIMVSSVQYLDDGSSYIICRDTFSYICSTTPPDTLGCYTITEYETSCLEDLPFTTNGNDDGYEIKIKIKNESTSETFHSLVITFEDGADFFWNPTVAYPFGADGLAPGDTSDWVYFTMSPNGYIANTTDICFNVHPVNEVGNYCCSEPIPYCVEIEPCCMADTSFDMDWTSVSSDNGSCCYVIDISNECAFNHVKKVAFEITNPNVSILSHNDMTMNWHTVSISDKEVHFYPNSDFIPKGEHDNLYEICLNNVDTGEEIQFVDLTWITCDTTQTGEELVYTDTLMLNCQPIISDTCLMVTNDTLVCYGPENYEFDFTVTNNSDHIISTIALIPMDGTMATDYYPQSYSTYLSPGQSTDLSISLFGDVGDSLAFKVRLFDAFNTDPNELNFCCYQTDLVSIELVDCCNDILILENDEIKNGDYYAKTKIIVKGGLLTDGYLNLHSPLVEVPENLDLKDGETITIDTDGCFENGALNFDGENDCVNILNYEPTLNKFTVATWIKADNTPANGSEERFFSLGYNHRVEVGMRENIDGKLWMFDSDGQSAIDLPYELRDDEWHHIAIVFDDLDRMLYLDGELVHSYTGTIQNDTYGPFFRVNGWHGSGAFFNGSMDEYQFWTDAKTHAEINDLMCNQTAVNEPNLEIYFDFNQNIPFGDNTSTNIIIDQTGNGHDGTLSDLTLTGSESNFVEELELPECCSSPPEISCYTVVYDINLPTQQVISNAEDFIQSTSSPCGYDLNISFSPTDITDTLMVFNCDDVGGPWPITIYVIDSKSNTNSCETYVEIQDSEGACEF